MPSSSSITEQTFLPLFELFFSQSWELSDFARVPKRGGAQLGPNTSAVGVAGQRNYSPAGPGLMKFRRKKVKEVWSNIYFFQFYFFPLSFVVCQCKNTRLDKEIVRMSMVVSHNLIKKQIIGRTSNSRTPRTVASIFVLHRGNVNFPFDLISGFVFWSLICFSTCFKAEQWFITSSKDARRELEVISFYFYDGVCQYQIFICSQHIFSCEPLFFSISTVT